MVYPPNVRLAEMSDADAITDINRLSLGYDFPPAKARAQLETLLGRGDVGIFVFGLTAVGYVHVCDYLCSYMPPLANIMAMAVLPDARRMGAGRALMETAENWAQSRNLSGVRLQSGWDRKGAHEFYKAVGYAEGKDHKNFIKYFC